MPALRSVLPKPPRVQCFTLVEMLVAVAVLSILVLLLAGILNTTGQAWLQAENGNDSFREARAALYVMRHDLQNAHISPNTPMVVNDSGLETTAGAAIGTNIVFFASLPQSAQQTSDDSKNTGDLCAIGYYVAYTLDDNQTTHSYKLYRYFRPSAYAYTNINQFVANSSGGTTSAEDNLKSLFAGLGPMPPDASEGNGDLGGGTLPVDEVVAHDVSNLHISWTTNAPTVTPAYSENSSTFTTNSYVEISFSVDALNSRFAVQNSSQQSWVTTNAVGYQRAAHSFSDQVSIPVAP